MWVKAFDGRQLVHTYHTHEKIMFWVAYMHAHMHTLVCSFPGWKEHTSPVLIHCPDTVTLDNLHFGL